MTHPRSILCPVILGRDDLLEQMDHLIGEAVQARGRSLFLSGQAGLGKTRLLRATIRKAEAAGLRVDGGSVAPQDHQVPLASIREMATGMRGNAAWGTLSEDLLAIDGRTAGDALGARRVIVRSVADRILEAIDRPTMLIFDDLHWTDEMSLEVVGELARHAAEVPLLLLGGYRADEFPVGTIHREWRSRLLSQRHAEEARLRRLTEDETATAITLILGGELPAPRDVVEAVHQRTNGIPLHIEELLAALSPDALSDGRLIREAHVPDTIGDAVLSRLSRLPDEVRLVARAGAVIGRCFSPEALAGVVGLSLPELEPSIQALVDAAILHPFDYIDQGYYDFRHQLLRDAIYSDVPPSQLRRFHAQAAEFVMGLEASSIIHASRHYERAGLRTQAYRSAMTGALEAGRVAAKQEALELYRRAIDNMPDDLSPGERAELLRSYAGTALAIERIGEALLAAREARRWFLEAGRIPEAAEMLVDIANGERKNGITSVEQRRALISQGLAEIESAGNDPRVDEARAQLLSFQSLNEFDAANFDEAARLNARYLAIARDLRDHEMELDAEFMQGMIALARGEDDATLERLVEIAQEARDAGYESVGVTSFRVAATMAARVMDYGAAKAAIREGLEYADAIEQSHCRQQMAATSALIDWASGDWDAASRRARQEAVERGCRRGALGAIPVIGFIAMGRGEVDEARRWLGDALAEGREIDDVEMILPPLWGLAELALVTGEPAVALARSEEALGIAQRTGERPFFVPFVVTGVRAALALHRPEDARRWLETSRGHIGGWTMAEAALTHAEGLVTMAQGHLTGARATLEAAVDGWQHRGRVWESAGARLDLAQCLLRSNRYAEAAGLIASVQQTAGKLGSLPLIDRAEGLQRLARGRGSVEEPWYPLTAREFEVARFVASGMTNPEIAEQLVLSPKTISAHVEHILAKLGVARRSEIAAWAATVARPEAAPTHHARPAAMGVAR
jgi:DNA-binding CsgD family transcriptional regulator/tetratricopeptide (TPR) repeat protein